MTDPEAFPKMEFITMASAEDAHKLAEMFNAIVDTIESMHNTSLIQTEIIKDLANRIIKLEMRLL